jgi:hypothetical protein
VPNYEDDDRAQRGAHEAGPLIRAIPPDALADPRREERACDPEHRREHETVGIVRAGEEKAGNDAGDQSDDKDPEKSAHDILLSMLVVLEVGETDADRLRFRPCCVCRLG